MLKGQAKKDYQRKYMKDYMRLRRQVVKTPELRPIASVSTTKVISNTDWQPEVDADGNVIYEE